MSSIEYAYRAFCKERFPPPTEEQVLELEVKIGVELPPDYRQHLLEYNGGWFSDPDIVPPVDECPLDGLTVMYGIGASHLSAELANSITLFDDNYPAQILPIGYTLMGNLLFVITHADNNGLIGMKIASSDKSFFLATGIADFFGLLREAQDDE